MISLITTSNAILGSNFTSSGKLLSSHTPAEVDAVPYGSLDRTGRDLGLVISVGSRYLPFDIPNQKGGKVLVILQEYEKTITEGVASYEIADSDPFAYPAQVLWVEDGENDGYSYSVNASIRVLNGVEDKVFVPVSGSSVSFVTKRFIDELNINSAKALSDLFAITGDLTEVYPTAYVEGGELWLSTGLIPQSNGSSESFYVTSPEPVSISFEFQEDVSYASANVYIDSCSGAVVVDYGDEVLSPELALSPEDLSNRYIKVGVVLLTNDEGDLTLEVFEAAYS